LVEESVEQKLFDFFLDKAVPFQMTQILEKSIKKGLFQLITEHASL